MKTITMLKVTLFLGSVMLATLSASALDGNRTCTNGAAVKSTCTSAIDGLTQEQISKITTMETAHQSTMATLRTEMRSTNDEKTKAEIRIKMIDARDSHRAEVKKLLTPQQQANFDALHLTNNHNYARNSRGNGKNRGNHNGSCLE